MAMMLWMMPIMIVVFAFNFPAALSLYWVVGNIFMIVQTYFIKGPDLKKMQIRKKREEQKSETNNCYRTNCRRSSRISFSSIKDNKRRTDISIIDEGKKGIIWDIWFTPAIVKVISEIVDPIEEAKSFSTMLVRKWDAQVEIDVKQEMETSYFSS